jgi:hypothetical protein
MHESGSGWRKVKAALLNRCASLSERCEAAIGFLAHLNVAVALSLAGIGADQKAENLAKVDL